MAANGVNDDDDDKIKKKCWPQTKNIHRYHHNKHLLWHHTIVMRARSLAPVCPIRKYHKKHIAKYNHHILCAKEERKKLVRTKPYNKTASAHSILMCV